MEDLTKKYLSLWEDMISATLLNPELQKKMYELSTETFDYFQKQASQSDEPTE